MKKTFFLSVAFIVVGLLSTGLPLQEGEAAAPKIVLNAVTSWPLSHVGTTYYKEFIKQVNERAKGELEIKLLGGPEVVSVFDQLKALSRGVVDLVHSSSAYYAGAVPEGTVVDLVPPDGVIPFLRESGVWDTYVQSYVEKSNAVFLGMVWPGLPLYVVTSKPVAKLEDIKGMKLRSLGGIIDVLVGQVDASIVKMASAEVYEGLQRGIVDGAIRNATSLVEFREYEVLKYIIFPPLCTSSSGVWIGEKKWNTIPKHLQTMMKEVMVETEKEAFDYYAKMDKARLKEVQEKHGMKVVYLGKNDVSRLNEIRISAPIKDWIIKRAPKYGPPIYEKMRPYLK